MPRKGTTYSKKQIENYRKAACAWHGCPVDPVERFWFYVDKSGGPDACWPWKAYKNPRGYGQVTWEGTSKLSHRIVYQLAKGIDPRGKVIYHTCDNPACCNPSHLKTGTQKDNVADKVAKGRQARGNSLPSKKGSCNNNAKLNEEKVRKIRLLETAYVPRKEIANKFNISLRTVDDIVKRRTWTHI